MTPQKTVSRLLIAFVLLSFGYIAFRSVRAAKAWRAPVAAQAASPGQRTELGSKIIAYYFHVNVRCTTCRLIESYSRQVVQQRFKDDCAEGRLEWRLVNVQEPENRHFIKDFDLFTKSLVLVQIKDGQQKEYKILNDTWELVGTPELMQQYVEREVREYLRKL